MSPAMLKTSEEIIADLTGVTNVLMPVSTLSFLFQRFDMLEKQLDDLKSRDTRDFAPPTVLLRRHKLSLQTMENWLRGF